jgi:hypothetical protein
MFSRFDGSSFAVPDHPARWAGKVAVVITKPAAHDSKVVAHDSKIVMTQMWQQQLKIVCWPGAVAAAAIKHLRHKSLSYQNAWKCCCCPAVVVLLTQVSEKDIMFIKQLGAGACATVSKASGSVAGSSTPSAASSSWLLPPCTV